MQKLNKIERLKKNLLPIYFDLNRVDFNNLSEDDRFYLKNWGIYNSKLRPETFMLRIRLDGQDLDKKAFLSLLNFAKKNNLKLLTTARGGLELHNILPKNVLLVYNRVHSFGFETKQSLTDNVRAIVTDPYDGFNSEIRSVNIIKEIREELIKNPEFFGTIPRKFNSAIVSVYEPIINFWGNDLLFAIAKKNNKLGFNIYLGGKNNQVAKSVDIFVEAFQVKKVFFAILKVFKDYGLRESRSKNRLYFLVEKIGMKNLRFLIQKEYDGFLERKGDLLLKENRVMANKEFVNGLIGSRLNCNFGEIDIENISNIVKNLNENDILRVGADGYLYIISEKKYKACLLSIQLCAGARYCPLSLWDIKKDKQLLSLKTLETNGISIGFSGCLKGCARHMHSNIGLVGLRTNIFGKTEKALRVFIGGYGGENGEVARLLYYSVPERCFKKLIDVIIKDFLESKRKSFVNYTKAILNKFDIEFLQIFFLMKYLDLCKLSLYKMYGNEFNDLSEEDIKNLAHKAWDIK